MTWSGMKVRIAVKLNRFANRLVNPNVMTRLRCTFLVPPTRMPGGRTSRRRPTSTRHCPSPARFDDGEGPRDAGLLPSWLELVRDHDLEARWVEAQNPWLGVSGILIPGIENGGHKACKEDSVSCLEFIKLALDP